MQHVDIVVAVVGGPMLLLSLAMGMLPLHLFTQIYERFLTCLLLTFFMTNKRYRQTYLVSIQRWVFMSTTVL